MKKLMIGSTVLLTVGMFLGVLLVSNISPDIIDGVFAANREDIGAKQPPLKQMDAMKILNESFNKVSEATLPSVVSIEVKAKRSNRNGRMQEFFEFFGAPRGQQEDDENLIMGNGSGVFISEDGYIITNNHVIEDAVEIKVMTNDRKEYEAELIGTDPLTDLAVIKIDGENLPAAHFAEIENVKTGEWVMAVGNPLGLNSTVTTGIISAIGRGQLNLNRDRYSVEYFIQTDAAINPGNSGGGLFNMDGSLVGINTAIATRTGNYIGYGFAIPVDLVESVVYDLIEDGKVDRGYIGVSIKSVEDDVMAEALGLDGVYGVKIEGVLEGSAAEDAGLEIGDVIVALDGEKLVTSNELQSKVAQKRAGDKVELTIIRDGDKMMKTVRLRSRDGNDDFASADTGENEIKKLENEPLNFKEYGFSIEPINERVKDEYEIDHGVLISKVERYSIASDRGLFPNGVIIEADRKEIKSTSQLKEIFESKEAGKPVLLQVKYPEVTRLIAIQIVQDEG